MPEERPHRGQEALSVRARARSHTQSQLISASSTITAARCGSSISKLIPHWHDKHSLSCKNDMTDPWRTAGLDNRRTTRDPSFHLRDTPTMPRNDTDRQGLPGMSSCGGLVTVTKYGSDPPELHPGRLHGLRHLIRPTSSAAPAARDVRHCRNEDVAPAYLTCTSVNVWRRLQSILGSYLAATRR